MHGLRLLELARQQRYRVFVEKIFEEGKNQAGVGYYQVRSWSVFSYSIILNEP